MRITLCMFLVLFAFQANADKSEKTYKMKWVLAHEPVRVFKRGADHFASEVSKATNGKVIVEVVSSKELNNGKHYTETEVFDLLRSGKIEMSQTYTSYLGKHNSKFWVLDLPFLFRDHDHVSTVLGGPIGAQIMAGLEPSNIKGLAFTYSGGFMILPTINKQIHSIEDFKGLKVRVNQGSPVATEFLKSLGAEPVTQKGKKFPKVDGYETTFSRIQEIDPKYQKLTKVINQTDHSIFLTNILINKTFFESLPAEYQEAIRKAALQAAKLEREDSVKDYENAKKYYTEKGYKIVSMDESQVKRFKDASASVYTKFEGTFGKNLIQDISNTK